MSLVEETRRRRAIDVALHSSNRRSEATTDYDYAKTTGQFPFEWWACIVLNPDRFWLYEKTPQRLVSPTIDAVPHSHLRPSSDEEMQAHARLEAFVMRPLRLHRLQKPEHGIGSREYCTVLVHVLVPRVPIPEQVPDWIHDASLLLYSLLPARYEQSRFLPTTLLRYYCCCFHYKYEYRTRRITHLSGIWE